MGSWSKFEQLSWSERWLFVQALLLLPLTALALQLFGFRRLQSAFASCAPSQESQEKVDTLVQQAYVITKLVKAAARIGPYHANCLQQSLVLWWLLRRQGIETDIRIGVRKETSPFEAHAWVEYLGLVLNDSADVYQRFAVFDRVISLHRGEV